MMKLQILSDLHGRGEKAEISKDADVLVYAGDLATTPKRVGDYFKHVRKMTDCPIVYVLGNHEYYGQIFPEAAKDYEQAVEGLGVELLDNRAVEIGELTFVGSTMWTDYDQGRDIYIASRTMADFEEIRYKTQKRLILPQEIQEAHATARAYLDAELSKHEGSKTVVVTHHLPSFQLIAPEYRRQGYVDMNSSFATNMDDLIEKYAPVLWVCGHTHLRRDETHGTTRCVCNPWGYSGEHSRYKEKWLIEI